MININILLANLIAFSHILLVIFILSPLIFNVPVPFLLIHPMVCILILLHWSVGNDVCAMTFVEQMLRGGIDKTESFIHRLVSPVYNYNTNNETTWMTVILILLILMSSWKIYTQKEEVIQMINEIRNLY